MLCKRLVRVFNGWECCSIYSLLLCGDASWTRSCDEAVVGREAQNQSINKL